MNVMCCILTGFDLYNFGNKFVFIVIVIVKGRNKILPWANAYAARDMVSTSHLQDLTASIADARQIPIELMLQSRQVLTILVVTRSIYRWFNARKT